MRGGRLARHLDPDCSANLLVRGDPGEPTGEGARLRQGSGVAGRSVHARGRVLPFPEQDVPAWDSPENLADSMVGLRL